MKAGYHRKLLTTKDLAELLNINEKMIDSPAKDKGFPATRVTGKFITEE